MVSQEKGAVIFGREWGELGEKFKELSGFTVI